MPDRLEGRFLVLSLHLFAVLHRLKAEGGDALDLAQELTDRFSADMETVLREIGVGDLSIPKKMRGLAAASASLLGELEQALPAGEKTVAAVLGQALPADQTLEQGCNPAACALSNGGGAPVGGAERRGAWCGRRKVSGDHPWSGAGRRLA